MAYRRYKRRRFSRRRKFRRTRRVRLNRRTGGLLGIEKKYQDVSNYTTSLGYGTEAFADTVVSGSVAFPALVPFASPREVSTADYCPYNAIPMQDGPNGRENRKVSLQSLYVDGSVAFQGGEAQLITGSSLYGCGTWTMCLAFVLDTQCNGSEPTGNEIWTTGPRVHGGGHSSFAGLLCSPLRNMANTDRFKVLKFLRFQYIPEWDRVEVAGDASKRWSFMGCRQYFKFKLNLKGLITTYTPSSTAAVTAAIRDNAIWAFAWATLDWDSTYAVPGNVPPPCVQMNTRLRFYG